MIETVLPYPMHFSRNLVNSYRDKNVSSKRL